MSLLSTRDLGVAIGATPIIEAVSLDLAAGEILALVGESGSGKSTTILTILDLLPAGARRTGTASLFGLPLPLGDDRAMQKVRGKDIGFISQEPMTALNPLMTIGDQVAETLRVHGTSRRREARRRAAEMLERVALPAARFPMHLYPHELSGGQRQRVAIAMALAASPKILLADEPTTALDVTTQAQILELLQSLVAERAMGMIFVTHDLGVVANIADRVAIMKSGRIVEEGETHAVFNAMKHPYSKALIQATRHVPLRKRQPRADDAPLLEADGLVRRYAGARRGVFSRSPGHVAVKNIELTLRPGEILAIVGESGSGKSTLLRMLLALDRPDAGRVIIDGERFSQELPANNLRRQRRHIQAVFQDPYGSFDPRWTVERLVGEPLALHDRRPAKAERRLAVEAALERVGLRAEDADKYAHEFSGGQRQRLAIARALIVQPRIIALDEAVSALDVSVRSRILDLLASLSDEYGTAYLFVTHDLTVVRAIADRVIVMKDGEVVEHGGTRDIFEAPEHDYTRALIAATPQIADGLACRASPSPSPSSSKERST